jgi:hypothetical protein
MRSATSGCKKTCLLISVIFLSLRTPPIKTACMVSSISTKALVRSGLQQRYILHGQRDLIKVSTASLVYWKIKSKNNILMYTEFITSTELAWQWLQGAESVINEWRTPNRSRDTSRERFTVNCGYLYECWWYICTTKLNFFQERLQFTAREGCFSGDDISLLHSLQRCYANGLTILFRPQNRLGIHAPF